MDFTTLLGLFLGLLFVASSIMLQGSVLLFVSLGSAILTFGGTFASILITFPTKDILKSFSIIKHVFFQKKETSGEVIVLLVKFAERARREGILALEKQMEEVSDIFLRNGIQLAVDGTEPELLREIMETELSYIEERHKVGRIMMEQLAALSPAWGMIGTLLGLVLMLASLDDPSKIGPGMALALITSFYGAMASYFVFQPFGNKLDLRTKEEILVKSLMLTGILSIQSGDNPRIVEQKLNSFIAPGKRRAREEK